MHLDISLGVTSGIFELFGGMALLSSVFCLENENYGSFYSRPLSTEATTSSL